MKLLVLDDGIPGNTNQALGIAESLNCMFEVYPVKLKGLSYTLPGRKGSVKIASKIIALLVTVRAYKLALKIFGYFSINSFPEGQFDIVISAGSYLAPLNLVISRKLKAKSVCIMTPEWLPIGLFDLLIIPMHDAIRYPRLKKFNNTFFTFAAPNRVKPEKLEAEKLKIKKEIKIPDDSIKAGIIIGGNDQNYLIDLDWAKKFLDAIEKVKGKTSFFLTTSRRTSEEVVKYFQNSTSKNHFIYQEFPGISSTSYYFGILGVCDILFVTEDSITMISEACSTGKPVIVVGVKRKKRKLVFDMTIEKLAQNGYCKYIGFDEFEKIPEIASNAISHSNYPILNESQKCAQKIMQLIN